MKYNFFLILLIVLITSCAPNNYKTVNVDQIFEKFSNNGFALIYNDKLYNDKTISKKMDERDLIIFQRNLRKGTSVKITNPFNSKTIIAKVGKKANYPSFNNSVVSIRISKELEIDINEPYIFIEEIRDNASFIAKKAKTFEEEKKVADKAPVDSISVNDLNDTDEKKIKKKINNEFKYVIKIADFYYLNTAKQMVKRIKSELNIKKTDINKINENKFRVFTGPYLSLKALQKAYNSIETLGFENIELIKYD
tara:strand:+ start:50 stop:805 length:756 start_codon:yes stop_codon:yes gene_type:complete